MLHRLFAIQLPIVAGGNPESVTAGGARQKVEPGNMAAQYTLLPVLNERVEDAVA